MAFVRVEQRNGRLASAVKVEYVQGHEGNVARGTVTVISNTRHGTHKDRTEEATAIQWTLWGKQAENAAAYLGKGSRVNVIGRMRNNNYTDEEGREIYGMSFTCEELDYLDSKAEAEARRSRQEWVESYTQEEAAATDNKSKRSRANGSDKAGSGAAAH